MGFPELHAKDNGLINKDNHQPDRKHQNKGGLSNPQGWGLGTTQWVGCCLKFLPFKRALSLPSREQGLLTKFLGLFVAYYENM
jgi:hypothetical protein